MAKGSLFKIQPTAKEVVYILIQEKAQDDPVLIDPPGGSVSQIRAGWGKLAA